MIEELNSGIAALKKLPKADLHSHILLSAPFQAYQEISDRSLALPPKQFKSFLDFQSYLAREILPLFKSQKDVEFILNAAFDQMLSDGVIYTETSFTIGIAVRIGASWKELTALLAEVRNRYCAMKICFEFGLYRELAQFEWRKDVEEALGSGVFGGVDLFGDELASEIDPFLPFFEMAHAMKLKVKFHTGEIGNSARAFSEIRKVRPHSIQHGITLVENKEALEFLKDEKISINICPASNLALSLVHSYETHPIKELLRSGAKVTIGTDDYGIFGKSLSEEYLALFERGILRADELEQIRQNGMVIW